MTLPDSADRFRRIGPTTDRWEPYPVEGGYGLRLVSSAGTEPRWSATTENPPGAFSKGNPEAV